MTRPWRVAVLSRQPDLYSTQRLLQAIRARAWEPLLLSPEQCTLVLGPAGVVLHYGGRPLPVPDAVISRVGSPLTDLGVRLLQALNQQGAWCLNGADAFALARDKWRSLVAMAGMGIPVPDTWYLAHPQSRDEALEALGAPVVAKLLRGSQGVGVTLAESAAGARGLTDTLLQLQHEVLLQGYLPGREDLRILVVGPQAVAAMARRAGEGEFRSNLHCGGQALGRPLASLDPDLPVLAVAATQALGLGMAGVDLMVDAQGQWRVLEVNPVPSLEGIERSSGVDVAEALMTFIAEALQGRASGPVPSQSTSAAPR